MESRSGSGESGIILGILGPFFSCLAIVANYAVLVGVVLAGVIVWRGLEGEKRPVPYQILARLVFVAMLWAVIEVVAPTKFIMRLGSYTNGNELTKELSQPMSSLAAAAFGSERVISGQSVLAKPNLRHIRRRSVAKKPVNTFSLTWLSQQTAVLTYPTWIGGICETAVSASANTYFIGCNYENRN